MNDSWKMAGPSKVLVPQFSATRPRLWESRDVPFNRTHSGLVKFSVHDLDYECVRHKLQEITSKATAILASRYLRKGITRPLPARSWLPRSYPWLIATLYRIPSCLQCGRGSLSPIAVLYRDLLP